MHWLQHNIIWIGLVLAIIGIFFIIARLTKDATIHEHATRPVPPVTQPENETPVVTKHPSPSAHPANQQH